MEPPQRQRTFHNNIDSKRFWNRIQNPFLWSKEWRLADFIAKTLASGARRLLEVGCGEGSNLVYLHNRLPDLELTGLDFSPRKVRFLNNCCPWCEAVCGDATNLPFAGGQFDAVLYRDVLHHVHWGREQLLSEGLRVLRPKGVMIVLEASGRTLPNRIFRLLYPAERGMKDSTSSQLLALGRRFGRPTLEHVEASLALRAVGFVIGWPDGVLRWLAAPLYTAATGWEHVVECVVPKRRWAYMMMALKNA